MNPNAYIAACKPLTLRQKQCELRSATQNANAAAALHDLELAEYYLGAISYLRLFDVVDEVLDVPKRRLIEFGWGETEQS